MWKQMWPYLLLIVAGCGLYFAFESIWKAAALVVASILIDIGLDEILLEYEKRKGKID